MSPNKYNIICPHVVKQSTVTKIVIGYTVFCDRWATILHTPVPVGNWCYKAQNSLYRQHY